jgi:(3,5-dihydroxyphenyl)acetyl-CoA 1,2-dioxygenase
MTTSGRPSGDDGGNSRADSERLRAAGLAWDAVAEWDAARPNGAASLAEDRVHYAAFWARSHALRASLPPKPKRSAAEAAAADAVLAAARTSREAFLKAHAATVYDELTDRREWFLRLDELVYSAAEALPGLTPRREEVAAEASLRQADKDGVEIDQGIFLSHVLAERTSGEHLCHAMLLPRPESAEALARFAADGTLDLGPVRLHRRGNAVHLESNHPRFLNAEDAETLALTEVAVDVAILDPGSAIGVLRGGVVDNPKYRGRHLFGAGINLTRLYQGEIPFLCFLERDMGYVHKLFRGVASPGALPDDMRGSAAEKPFVAAVDGFAIGGHCQLLLVVDYVLAANDAYLTLPARKEGIIPGFANLRLPRFVGDRIARQAIQYERRLACDSPEGRLICDEVVPPGAMEEAIARVTEGLTNAGAVSAVGNRRAFRVAQEPLDAFRRYASVYAREQAYCHFSPALIANLARNWNTRQRKA